MVDLDYFLPEHLKGKGNIIGKIVDVFKAFLNKSLGTVVYEKDLNGEVKLDENGEPIVKEIKNPYEFDFEAIVNSYSTYWDTIRNKDFVKVQRVLDPLAISDFLVDSNEKIGKFLYYMVHLYERKGTLEAVRYLFQLVGLDAEIVRWYQPEFKKETKDRYYGDYACEISFTVKVGNKPAYVGQEEIFENLVILLLDVCVNVGTWYYTKVLTDKVDAPTEKFFLQVSQLLDDKYIHCLSELMERYGYTLVEHNYRKKGFSNRWLDLEESMKKRCTICDYVYDPCNGRETGLGNREPFDELPPDWICPRCKSGKETFVDYFYRPYDAHALLLFLLKLLLFQSKLSEQVVNLLRVNNIKLITTYPKLTILVSEINSFLRKFNFVKPNRLEGLGYLVEFLDLIRLDNYTFYEYAGKRLDSLLRDIYSRGYSSSPYILYGHPDRRIYRQYGPPSDDECEFKYDGEIIYGHPDDRPTDIVYTYQKEPTIYYNKKYNYKYDGQYTYNILIDFNDSYYKKGCVGVDLFDFPSYTENGVFPYLRYGPPPNLEKNLVCGYINYQRNERIYELAYKLVEQNYMDLLTILEKGILDNAFYKEILELVDLVRDTSYEDELKELLNNGSSLFSGSDWNILKEYFDGLKDLIENTEYKDLYSGNVIKISKRIRNKVKFGTILKETILIEGRLLSRDVEKSVSELSSEGKFRDNWTVLKNGLIKYLTTERKYLSDCGVIADFCEMDVVRQMAVSENLKDEYQATKLIVDNVNIKIID